MLTSVFTNKERDCNRSPFLVFGTTTICGFFASCLRNKIFCNPRISGVLHIPQILTGTEVGREAYVCIALKARKH